MPLPSPLTSRRTISTLESVVLTVKHPYPPPETITIGPELTGKTAQDAAGIVSARHAGLSFSVETK